MYVLHNTAIFCHLLRIWMQIFLHRLCKLFPHTHLSPLCASFGFPSGREGVYNSKIFSPNLACWPSAANYKVTSMSQMCLECVQETCCLQPAWHNPTRKILVQRSCVVSCILTSGCLTCLESSRWPVTVQLTCWFITLQPAVSYAGSELWEALLQRHLRREKERDGERYRAWVCSLFQTAERKPFYY